MHHLHPTTGTNSGSGREIVQKASLDRLAAVLAREANLNLYGKQRAFD
jgi:hypothetical protein